jgi:outer membrane receptor protein involved in Fe transport
VSVDPATNLNGAAGAAHARTVCEALMTRDSADAGVAPNTGVAAYYGDPASEDPDPGSAGTSVVRGNPTVQPETANTYTVGLVLTSPFQGNAFLEGFTASFDYYQIEIEELISVTDVPPLFNDCLGLTTNPGIELDRFSCVAIVRDPLDGSGLFIDRTYTNAGRAKLSGVDIQITWRGEFDELGLDFIPGSASVNILATIPVEQITQANPTAPEVDAVGTQYSNLGVGGGGYEYTTLTTFNYFVGDWTATLRWQYSPSIESAQYATNPATTSIGVPTGASLFSLSGSYRVNNVFTLRAGVDNLFDTLPPCAGGDPTNARFPMACVRGLGGFGSSGAGAGAYDVLGRRFFVGVNASF